MWQSTCGSDDPSFLTKLLAHCGLFFFIHKECELKDVIFWEDNIIFFIYLSLETILLEIKFNTGVTKYTKKNRLEQELFHLSGVCYTLCN